LSNQLKLQADEFLPAISPRFDGEEGGFESFSDATIDVEVRSKSASLRSAAG
jgi:hypothetical protein